MKWLGFVLLCSLIPVKIYKPGKETAIPVTNTAPVKANEVYDYRSVLNTKAKYIRTFAADHNYSTTLAFLADMSLPSGKNRFFIYDLRENKILHAGLVAHGSCREGYLDEPRFSNTKDCGCSSLGKYKIGYSYQGNFGKAFKLFGLDSMNSNAFDRAVVFHSYSGVPEAEVYPENICNSLGCPMVSPGFMNIAAPFLEHSSKPVLLYIYR